ncbi:S1 family peptidase [Streptomyces sp. WAC 00631]|uniref:hypothetical protein n=1 Tax=Streptomyces sp. WAC 00631 TaxID=2203201 RepID=UPI000F77661B|nr:hypothetical protein [Streptomyces sp. WAC 00631]MCC5034811.1 S1 family peptidase [Streptomyces sp. WAC 00631]
MIPGEREEGGAREEGPPDGPIPHDHRIDVVKERFAARLMTYPNVTGVGVGLRMRAGRRLSEPCVRVFVSRKVPEAELRTSDVLPRELEGVTVDVVEGEFTLLRNGAPPLSPERRRARHFPFAVPGTSVAGLRVTAGTLGAAVYDATGGGSQLLLSNWHVLCGVPECAAGEEIVQPGPFDGGTAPRDTVARLLRYADTDRVDAAVAILDGNRFLSDAIAGIGLVSGVGAAGLGMRARKSGRTTGVTGGIIDAVGLDVTVGGRLFRGQFTVASEDGAPVVAGGDSGSLTVDDRNRAVGLLFAGRTDGAYWIANPIADVIAALGIRFTPDPLPLDAAVLLTAADS